MMGLTDTQKFLFDLQGYLLIENALRTDEIEALKTLAYELARQKHPEEWSWTAEGEPAHRMRIHRPFEKDETYLGALTHPSYIDIITQITGGAPKLIDNDIDLVPHDKNQQGWHRGVEPYGYAVHNGVPFCTMVKIAVYLTDVGPGEGPTRIIPGSHKANFLPGDLYGSLEDKPGSIELTVKAGTALIFSEALLHAGNVNMSSKTRVNFYINYGPSWVEPWEGYRPSESIRSQSSGLLKQLLGGGRIYNHSEEHGLRTYR